MNRTLEAFATRNTESSRNGGGKSTKTFKKPKEFKDDSDNCIDIWVAVIRLHLEQDNLNATYLKLSKDNALTSEEMSK